MVMQRIGITWWHDDIGMEHDYIVDVHYMIHLLNIVDIDLHD